MPQGMETIEGGTIMTQQRLVQELVFSLRERYHSGSRKLRTQILDDLCRDFKRPRKSLVRLFSRARLVRDSGDMSSRRGRPEVYGAELFKWAAHFWDAMGLMNAKAMKQALPLWLSHIPQQELPDSVRKQLLDVSASTLDRILAPHKRAYWKKLRSGTRRKLGRGHIRFFKDRVPIRRFDQDIKRPGFMEADTVAHCGESMAGQFIWTLNMTDHLTGWCEQRAVWHKDPHFVLEAVIDIQTHLPFTMWGLHTDNGMEFLNAQFVDHWNRDDSVVGYTRGRPYFKQDQARVEQKNFTHVRKILGYERLDDRSVLSLVNDIYQNEHRLLMNFFVPQSKLIEKRRIGSKKIKTFDSPKTPYERLLAANTLSELEAKKLQDLLATLNPFELQQRLRAKLQILQRRLKNPGELTETDNDTMENKKPFAA